MRFYSNILFLLAFVCFSACGSLEGLSKNSQYTNKAVAPVFVSQLYGNQTQVLTISHPKEQHIAWMGFVQSNDYGYFRIVKVQIGSKVIAQDGVDFNGETFVSSSNSILSDITVPPSQSDGVIFDPINGSVSVSDSDDLKITIEYKPLVPIVSEEKPHTAYLLVNYDVPQTGVMRIKLEGYTQGVKEDKCTQSTASMEALEYEVIDDSFALYFCSAQVAKYGVSNTPQDAADPNYHGLNTNLAYVPYDQVLTIYKADETTACLVTGEVDSVPAFDLSVPDIGSVPIDELSDIHMTEGSYAQCDIDAEGNLNCDENILIKSIVSLSAFSMTNQSFDAEQLKTADCSDFGSISGSGNLYDTSSDLHLIIHGRTLSDTNTESYQIVDSLIVADIALKKIN